MEENEKPFACATDGCRMRFTNEDHLTVHKKKHDMILNLGNGQKSNAFVADQTPTPTRFIRNCEEVGLFHDLQINPFDETFKKAVEAGKSGHHLHYADSLAVPAAVDDTLHTPHVFPFPHANDDAHHFKPASVAPSLMCNKKDANSSACKDVAAVHSSISSDSSSNSTAPVETFSSNTSLASNKAKRARIKYTTSNARSAASFITTVPVGTSRLPPIKPAITATDAAVSVKKETVSVAGQSMQLLLRMPDGKLVQLVQEGSAKPPPADTVTPTATPENGLAIAKMKLKQALKNNGRIAAAPTEAADLSRVSPPAPAPAPVPVERPSPTSSCYAQRESLSGDDDDGRKSKFRERNRAAAKRCREKRQTWVQELEKRADVMHSTNLQLQGEVTSLRAEVAQLKTLLLAHKNCPITQAMNNSQMINISCLPISTIQTCLLPTSQPSRIVYQPTASTSSQQQSSVANKVPILPSPASPVTSPSKRKRHRSGNNFVTDLSAKSSDNDSMTNGHFMLNGRNATASSSNWETGNNQLATSRSSYVNRNHLLSACAANENNVNLERFKNATLMERFENDDGSVDLVIPTRINGVGSSRDSFATDGGGASKVIKLNPNAVRFKNAEEIIRRDSSMAAIVIVDGTDSSDCEVITGDC